MTIEEAIFTRLTTFAGLVALIASKVFPLKAPHDFNAPYVTYQKISGNRFQAHEGNSDLSNPRFQFSCWAVSYKQAKLVANQVVSAMHAFKGVVDGVDIQMSGVDSEVDTYDEETKLFRVIIDIVLWHREVIT